MTLRLRSLPHIAAALLAACAATSACNPSNENDTQEASQEWIDANNAFYTSRADVLDEDGQPFYTRIVPPWNSLASIMIHWYNDRALTAGNLSPMLTSTVNVKYEGRLYDGSMFDNSYSNTDSIFSTKVSGVIEGWTIALCEMHVGDSVQVVIPAAQAYGSTGSGSSIPPYSTLVFNFRLVDVPAYEVP